MGVWVFVPWFRRGGSRSQVWSASGDEASSWHRNGRKGPETTTSESVLSELGCSPSVIYVQFVSLVLILYADGFLVGLSRCASEPVGVLQPCWINLNQMVFDFLFRHAASERHMLSELISLISFPSLNEKLKHFLSVKWWKCFFILDWIKILAWFCGVCCFCDPSRLFSRIFSCDAVWAPSAHSWL